jgi:hypothetical protein
MPSLFSWKRGTRSTSQRVLGSRSRNQAEVEVQAGWWMRVSIEDFKIALNELGIHLPA